jgi:hypothetical protein
MKEVVNIIKQKDRDLEQVNRQNTVETEQENQKQYTPLYEPQAAPEQNPTEISPNGLSRTEWLLNEILDQLKKNQRSELFSEFSVTRVMAGIVQVMVLFCILICIWLLMSPTRQDNYIFISLGFAVVFQVMALTFFIMRGQK